MVYLLKIWIYPHDQIFSFQVGLSSEALEASQAPTLMRRGTRHAMAHGIAWPGWKRWLKSVEPWKTSGKLWKTLENYGKPRKKLWKPSGKLWKTPGKLWKTPGKLWKTPGKLWKTPGKVWKTPGKCWTTMEKPPENYRKTLENYGENDGTPWKTMENPGKRCNRWKLWKTTAVWNIHILKNKSTWRLHIKGMLANPRTFSMICADLNCSLRHGHSSFVVRCTSPIRWRILTLEVLVGAWTVPAGFPHIDVPFSTASDFEKFESHLSFYFLADLGDGYVPRRSPQKSTWRHENFLCAHLNSMYPSQGFMCFFSFFFQKKNGWERFESPQNWASPQSWANLLGHDFFGFSIRRASRFRDFSSGN